ncbi:hypothetical protein FRB96_004093 [Tulasnella sp. 330]|nr:hypothetical protein FRB96_004093 [Tulasnella sp. 330]KAG8880645.1 hypothetical protein FRB98_004959 [Tulasnella sp. 332]
MGCYQDQSARTLSGPSTTSSSSMTPAFCEAFCNTATGGPYTFAGVENSVECYCGNTLTVNTPLAASNCQSKCSGDASQFCGGNNWQVALYQAPTATGTGTTTTATSTATGTTTSGFTSLGCYQDQSARTLGGPSTTSSTAMTPAFCENFCNTATGGPYQFAGVENSVECYCGNTLTVNTPLAASNCQTKCSGDATQFCGGNNWQVALYKTGTGTGTTTTSAATSTATSGSTLLGCYQDQTPRTLSGPSTTSSTMTPAVCKAYCASQGNYLFYGLENATECYCGQALIPNTPIAASNCQSKCAGDQTQLCGGSNWQVAVYQNGGSGTTTSTSTSATATSTSTVWTLMGCYQDQSARTLGGPSTTSSSSMTPAFCEAFCNTATGGPYQYAGVENSVECYCGNMLTVNSVLAASNCQTKCSGDATQFCGGNNWQVAVYQRSASTNTNTNTTLTTLGCYQDQSSRTLNGASTISSTMTPAVCKTYCSTASGAPYTYFGVENSSECYCGNTLIPNSPLALTNCAAKCAGDATQTCGGTNWELNLYAMSSTTTVVPSATYKQVGCFVDTSSRLLPIAAPSTATTSSTTYTPAACEAYCSSQNYAYAGVESGGECYCGGSLAYSNSGAGTQAALSDCSQACSANTAMQCGGGWRLMVYYDAALDTGAC